jgi:glycosyltransferase involved in cell wall biosynthesis
MEDHPAQRPHLLILCPVLPFPPVTGMTRHIAAMVPALAVHFRITLFVLCDADQTPDWSALAGTDVVARAFVRSFRRMPLYPPALQWWQAATLDTAIDTLLATDPPALVQLEYSGMAHYAPRFGRIPTICTATALDTLGLWRRLAHTPGGYPWLRRALGMLVVAWHEYHALRRVGLVVTHGAADLVLLQRFWRFRHAIHIPSGLPLLDVPPTPAAGGPQLVCVGHFAHQPNRDGVEWFLQTCWPALRAQFPTLTLHLVGATPAEVGGHDGVIAHGVTTAVAAFYADATAVIVPIHWGSGVRIKILEAVSARRPIVTTRMAVEGLPLRDGTDILIADEPMAFVAAVARLLTDAALGAALTHNARQQLASLEWPAVADRLAAAYRPLWEHPHA